MKLSRETVNARLKNLGYDGLHSEYYNVKTKVKLRCLLCGSFFYVRLADVFNSRTISCGCRIKNQHMNKSCCWTGYGKLSGDTFSGLRKAARRTNKEFTVTKKYLWDLFIKQEEKCFYCNQQIHFCDKSKDIEQTVSLDRIDIQKGYIEGNVRWVHKTINMIRWILSHEDFIKWCHLITYPILDTIPSDSCVEWPKHGLWNGCGNISHTYYNKIKYRAKIKTGGELDFTIAIDDIWNLFLQQSGRCSITGVKIGFSKRARESNKQTASLDRIDGARGYVIDNVQWVHKIINSMKGKRDEKIFLEYCNMVTNNYKD